MTIAELLAAKLATGGLDHPGNGDDQPPFTMRLPMFKPIGAPPPMQDLVNENVKLMAEAIVHFITTEGNCDITPREETP